MHISVHINAQFHMETPNAVDAQTLVAAVRGNTREELCPRSWSPKTAALVCISTMTLVVPAG